MRVGVFSILSTLYNILYITISAKKHIKALQTYFFLAFVDYMYIKQYIRNWYLFYGLLLYSRDNEIKPFNLNHFLLLKGVLSCDTFFDENRISWTNVPKYYPILIKIET